MSAAAIGIAVLLAQAAPYNRLGSTNEDGIRHCLWWPTAPISLQAHVDGTPDVTPDEEFGALSRSIETWRAQFTACSDIAVSEGARSRDRYVGFNVKAPSANENVILFRQKGICSEAVPDDDACWDETVFYCANVHDCWPHARDAIAVTTNSFDGNNGRVFDADVEFHDARFRFTATVEEGPVCSAPDFEGCVFYDLENTMTHELGHVFGLDHSSNTASTMYPDAAPGHTFMRSLDADSQQFVCDVYPKGGHPQDCVLERLDPDLGRSASCATVPAAPAGVFALLVLFGWRRRGS